MYKRQAHEAAAVDIEENAVSTSIRNALKNNISMEKYHAYCGNIISDIALRNTLGSNYDIITANIVADILIAMSELFKKFLKPEGLIIISGIITERKTEVIKIVTSCGFEVIKEAESDGWAAVLLKVV